MHSVCRFAARTVLQVVSSAPTRQRCAQLPSDDAPSAACLLHHVWLYALEYAVGDRHDDSVQSHKPYRREAWWAFDVGDQIDLQQVLSYPIEQIKECCHACWHLIEQLPKGFLVGQSEGAVLCRVFRDPLGLAQWQIPFFCLDGSAVHAGTVPVELFGFL